MQENKCTCMKHKTRNEEEKKALLNRLHRIEGQVRGLEKMVEDDIYCVDIMNQATAVRNAMNSFITVLLDQHIHSCVLEDLQAGKEETLDELLTLMKKLMK